MSLPETPVSSEESNRDASVSPDSPPINGNGHMILYSQNFQPIHEFKGQHILSAKQFNLDSLETIFLRASQIEELDKTTEGRLELLTWLQTFRLASLFYQPSTRTRSHFEMAMEMLGGRVFSEQSVELSSRFKGEPLGHTVRVLNGGGDAVVIRDPQDGFFHHVLEYAKRPLFNGGDGAQEHPLQALKDYYIKRQDFGSVHGITETYFGDIKHGRTVHSSALLTSLHRDVTINFVAPGYLRAPREMVETLRSRGTTVNEFQSLDQMEQAGQEPGQALYATRLQIDTLKRNLEAFDEVVERERMITVIKRLERIYKEGYAVTPEFMARHPDTLLYHPLPIDRKNGPGEIPQELDFHPRSRFFAQSDTGYPVAAALLDLVLRGNPAQSTNN